MERVLRVQITVLFVGWRDNKRVDHGAQLKKQLVQFPNLRNVMVVDSAYDYQFAETQVLSRNWASEEISDELYLVDSGFAHDGHVFRSAREGHHFSLGGRLGRLHICYHEPVDSGVVFAFALHNDSVWCFYRIEFSRHVDFRWLLNF